MIMKIIRQLTDFIFQKQMKNRYVKEAKTVKSQIERLLLDPFGKEDIASNS